MNLSESMLLGGDSNVMSRGGFFTVAVVIYFALILIALIVNSMKFVVLWRLRRKLFKPPGTFYPVVVGLMLFTTLNAAVQAVFVAPPYVQPVTENEASSSSYTQSFFILDMVSNYGILGFSTLVAGNRYSTFVLGCTCPVFVRPRVYYLIALVFLIVTLSSVAPYFLGCTMLHAATAAGYVDMCPYAGLAEGIKIALAATYYVLCLVSAQFYVRTYFLIKDQRGHLIEHESHRTAPETVILKQALVIFGLYVISLVLSTILPIFCTSHSFILSFSLNSISLLLSIVYPGLFLVSARDMRKEVTSWIPWRAKSCWRREKRRISSAESINGRYGMQSKT